MKRKIIQVLNHIADLRTYVVLCDDGSLWMFSVTWDGTVCSPRQLKLPDSFFQGYGEPFRGYAPNSAGTK